MVLLHEPKSEQTIISREGERRGEKEGKTRSKSGEGIIREKGKEKPVRVEGNG